ncbi:MAG: biotin/lipoyl-binding protein [Synergistaceae bacterium]|nr:biotin/lipoyl-binding protein [Synergistaceae bacterium]
MSLKYKVTVDGTAYTVEVEELGGVASAPAAAFAPVARVAPAAPAPVAAPAPTPAPAAVPVAAPVAAGTSTIEAPMPGKVLDVKVAVGATVNSGDLVLMLEAMKMENEIFAPTAGTVKEVRVKSGDSVNTGDVLIVLG